MIWRIRKYIQHLFYLHYRKGHGIHSPYLFEFVNKVIFNGAELTVPPEIIRTHRELKKDRTQIPEVKLGAASHVNSTGERSAASFVRHSSVSEKYGALLYRISRWFEPEMIIELGSGLGISSLYLASGSPHVPLHSIEGNPHRASFAEKVVAGLKMEMLNIHQGEMDEELNKLIPHVRGRFVAFVDGNHRYEPTIAYVRKLMEVAGDEALIIMDDIYWSKEMFKAWEELKSWPESRVSVDLYQMGIILLRRDLAKASFKFKF